MNMEQKNKIDPNLALNTISSLGEKFIELQTIKEENKKELEKIQADKIIILKKIETTREVLMKLLDKSFDERAIVLKKKL